MDGGKSGIDRHVCTKICRSCRGNRKLKALLLTSKGLTKGRTPALLTSRFQPVNNLFFNQRWLSPKGREKRRYAKRFFPLFLPFLHSVVLSKTRNARLTITFVQSTICCHFDDSIKNLKNNFPEFFEIIFQRLCRVLSFKKRIARSKSTFV